MVTHKICTRCKKDLPAADFYKVARRRGGEKSLLSSVCVKCTHEKWTERRSDPDKVGWMRLRGRMRYDEHKSSNPNFMQQQRDAKRIWWMDQFYQAIKAYGGKCRICGEERKEALVLHHINGNGRKHRKELSKHNIGSSAFYYYLRKNGYPKGLETLCGTCHLILHRMEGKRWQYLDSQKPQIKQ